MSQHEHWIAGFRKCLLKVPYVGTWWELMGELEALRPESREICIRYLKEQLEPLEKWNCVRVPCGDWPKDHVGWLFSNNMIHELKSFGGIMEIYCPPGRFLMGPNEEEREDYGDTTSQREVEISRGFWALSIPVTQGIFNALMGEKKQYWQGEDLPVMEISWFEAMEFCNALSRVEGREESFKLHSWIKEGVEDWELNLWEHPPLQWEMTWRGLLSSGYRLPTEAEWEYMCRAGSTSSRYAELSAVAWYQENSKNRTHPVKARKPNAWGFYDLLGNVWEWCMDSLESGENRSNTNPVQFSDEELKVCRGGCYGNEAAYLRAASRIASEAQDYEGGIGFRIVRTELGDFNDHLIDNQQDSDGDGIGDLCDD